MSFVERSIILCPYLGGSTVSVHIILIFLFAWKLFRDSMEISD